MPFSIIMVSKDCLLYTSLNRAAVEKKAPAGIILSEDEDTSILLNGDDHIRIQLLSSGLHLEELWERADALDDYINERFPYAFDDRYGYLTSFPTNVGTGLRASVVVHLPMLSSGRKFPALIADMSRFGTAVRGVYGEGEENFGSLYEISNQKTLGPVSYTHLDVYKRQSQHCRKALKRAPMIIRERKLWPERVSKKI